MCIYIEGNDQDSGWRPVKVHGVLNACSTESFHLWFLLRHTHYPLTYRLCCENYMDDSFSCQYIKSGNERSKVSVQQLVQSSQQLSATHLNMKVTDGLEITSWIFVIKQRHVWNYNSFSSSPLLLPSLPPTPFIRNKRTSHRPLIRQKLLTSQKFT